jgi:hypothetical protein
MTNIGVPLAVTAGTSRYTARISELTFRDEAPGGGRYITFDIPVDRFRPDPELALLKPVYVSDARTGIVIAEGLIADVAWATEDPIGQVVRVTAWGPKTHASESSTPVIYYDSLVSTWDSDSPNTTDVIQVTDMEDSDDDGESKGFRFKADTGETITVTDEGFVEYRQMSYANQPIGRLSGTWRAGLTDTGYSIVRDGRASSGSAWTGISSSTLSTGGPFTFSLSTGNIPNATRLLRVGLTRNVSSITGARTHWLKVWNLRVEGLRYKADGTQDTAAGSYGTIDGVYDQWIVKDVLGRLLTRFDGANATVYPTNVNLGHFAYYDSVTAEQILEDVMAATGNTYWYTYPAQYYNGKATFLYWTFPTIVRYEVTLDSPADMQTSTTELYNKVTVRWKDKKGRPRTTVRTSTGDLLSNAGLTRQAFVDVGSTLNTVATAQKVGDSFLAVHSKPVNAGSLTVNRPVRDILEGGYREPWEILPGELVRLRGSIPDSAGLATTVADGDVARIAAVEYTASSNSARLDLNFESPTVAKALRTLSRKMVRRA